MMKTMLKFSMLLLFRLRKKMVMNLFMGICVYVVTNNRERQSHLKFMTVRMLHSFSSM